MQSKQKVEKRKWQISQKKKTLKEQRKRKMKTQNEKLKSAKTQKEEKHERENIEAMLPWFQIADRNTCCDRNIAVAAPTATTLRRNYGVV